MVKHNDVLLDISLNIKHNFIYLYKNNLTLIFKIDIIRVGNKLADYRRGYMNINDLVSSIIKNGLDTPKIAVMTPEIRTIDERVSYATEDRFEFLEDEE